MRFKPTSWGDMPLCARKTILRIRKAFGWYPGDQRLMGWEWVTPMCEPCKVYAQARDGRWYVATEPEPIKY